MYCIVYWSTAITINCDVHININVSLKNARLYVKLKFSLEKEKNNFKKSTHCTILLHTRMTKVEL